MKSILLILGVLGVLFLFTSCKNDGLTREKASEIISKNFPRKVYNQFNIGKYISYSPELTSNDFLGKMKNQGLINITGPEDITYGLGILHDYIYQINVPDDLKKYIGEIYKDPKIGSAEDESLCLVKIGEQSFVGITGIHEINEHEAEVEYSWTFTNSTPFANFFKSYILFNDDHRSIYTSYYYNEVVRSDKVIMQKFDDGWRLSSTFNYPTMYKQATDPDWTKSGLRQGIKSEEPVKPSMTNQHDYYYEPTVSIISGFIKNETFFGPPGYGENPQTDSREECYILNIDNPINVISNSSEKKEFDFNDTKYSISKIQLTSTSGVELSNYKNKLVRLTGTFFGAISGNHHTEILMDVKAIQEE